MRLHTIEAENQRTLGIQLNGCALYLKTNIRNYSDNDICTIFWIFFLTYVIFIIFNFFLIFLHKFFCSSHFYIAWFSRVLCIASIWKFHFGFKIFWKQIIFKFVQDIEGITKNSLPLLKVTLRVLFGNIVILPPDVCSMWTIFDM